MKTIKPTELNQLIAEGKETELLDVRTPAEYRGVHVPGARSEPLGNFDDVKAVLSRRTCATDAPLYILCQSGKRACMAVEKFSQAGFPHAVLVEGGTQAWIDASLPVVRGVGVISIERQVRIAAGSLVLLGLLLGWFLSPAWFLLSAFVGCGLIFAGITDFCGMALLLARMPWNK